MVVSCDTSFVIHYHDISRFDTDIPQETAMYKWADNLAVFLYVVMYSVLHQYSTGNRI